MRKSKLEKEANKQGIVLYSPIYESGKRIIYYCDYGFHQGFISDRNKIQTCVNRLYLSL